MSRRDAPRIFVKIVHPNGEGRVASGEVRSFEFIDSERKADRVRLTVDNDDLRNFDDPIWRKGGKIVVSWGYVGNMAPARTCVIRSVKGFRELEIEAVAESIVMDRFTVIKTWEGKTRSQIVSEIAKRNGYRDADIQTTSEVYESIVQRATDAQFLRQLANKQGFEFYIDHTGFHWHERRLGSKPIRTLTYRTSDGGDFIGDPSIENDLTAKPGRTKVKGRDALNRKNFETQADNDTDTDRDSLSEIADVIDPETGEITTVQRPVSTEETRSTTEPNESTAKTEAKARFRRNIQLAVKMKAEIVGDPQLFAKSVIRVDGIGKRLSQPYWVKEVTHSVSSSGYTTSLDLVSDGHGGHSTSSTTNDFFASQESGTKSKSKGNVLAQYKASLSSLKSSLRSDLTDTNQKILIAVERLQKDLTQNQLKNRNVHISTLARLSSSATEPNRTLIAQSRNILVQSKGSEASQGGKVNDQSSDERTGNEEGTDLTPVEIIDPETGETVTIYR